MRLDRPLAEPADLPMTCIAQESIPGLRLCVVRRDMGDNLGRGPDLGKAWKVLGAHGAQRQSGRVDRWNCPGHGELPSRITYGVFPHLAKTADDEQPWINKAE